MRKILSIQTIFLLHALVLHCQTQPFFWGNNTINLSTDKSNYQTIIYGTQSGLVSSEITCLTQDSKGFLWIGTSSGLSKYDGNKFENFLKADNHFTGKIYAVKEDTFRNILWIACDAGLCYFHNKQLHFVNFKEPDVTVYDIYFLKDKNIWIGTGKGPAFIKEQIIDDVLTGKSFSLSSFLLPQWNSLDNPVYKITGSETGTMYFGGEGNVFSYNKKVLKKIWTSQHEQESNDNVVGMVAAKDDTIFFASVLSGMYYVAKDEIKKLPYGGYVSADLIEHDGSVYYFSSDGIFQLQSFTKNLIKISEVPQHLNLWISCLLIDNENNLWIGLHDNLLYQKPHIFFTYQNIPASVTAELYSVYQLKNHDLLFGANRGKVYKKHANSFKNILGTGQVVPNAEIKSMYEDSRGWLWLGTGYEGIAVIKNNKVTRIAQQDGLSSNSNYFFYEDGKKNIYTGGDGGFSKINFDTITHHFILKNFSYVMPGDNIETFKSCIAGPDGTLWLGGQKGIFYLKNDSLIHYALNKEINVSVTDIKKDKSGNVWLATKGDGIWQCYFDNNNMLQPAKIFTDKDGLGSNIFLSIAIDHNNNVWAGSYSGITSVKENNKKFTIVNYTSNDGFLSSNYQSLKIYCDDSDTMWVATSSGLTSFYINNTSINKKLLLNFTTISLLDTSQKIDDFKKNTKDSVIELPYFLNGIEFAFKAICLSDPQKINYSYRLLGIADTAWFQSGNKETVIYQNLSPGNYSFQVKASLDNSSSGVPVTFSFTIKKPFWLSWWFIIICSLIGICIIYFIVKKWKKNIHEKNEKKIATQKLISENLQYQLEIEQVTNYFATSISASETVDALLWNVARQCISKLNFEDCVIYLIDEQKNMLIQKAAWGPKSYQHSKEESIDNKILSPIEILVGKGIVGSVALTGVAEIIPDVTKDGRYIKDDMQRSSEIAVPVIYDNHILGVIDSESRQKNFYSQRHLQILTAIASHCAERIVKLKAEEELRRNEAELLQTKNRLAEEKLTALRSQMNPHFIFNCLNSIQQYILKGEVDNANKYLSRFSKLIRLVLQYSEYNFIRLEDEINMLQLYLSLEKIRFGNSFEYNINIEEELDTEEIKIPNLMIQPFVENAIWHGLMHKEGDRKIEIKFSLMNEQSLVCEITDNGIGRKKASEIKELKSLDIKHQSKGMQLVKDKIDVLKQQFTSEIFIELSDVTDSNGEICGTKVLLQLPLQYQ